jgi:hypothetical protein
MLMAGVDQEEVMQFVGSLLRFTGVVRPETTLFPEMEVCGDDVDMLLFALRDKYGIDLSNVKLDDYFFMSEGLPLAVALLGVYWKWWAPPPKQMKVSHILRAVELRSLSTALTEKQV